MRSSILLALGAAVSVSAQNFTSCCDVTPNTVDINERLAWCRAQRNTCPLVCANGQVSANDCDENTLKFTCTCGSGTTPNISDYSQTLPSLECDEWKRQCVAAAPDNLVGQNFCLKFTCGLKNASSVGAGATASGSTPGGASQTSSGGASSTSGGAAASSSGAAVMLRAGQDFGTGALLLGIFAIFGFAL